MPTYDYQCRACGTVTEVIHSMLDSGPSACAECGGELRRVLYPTGIIFKGSGFYRTDSRQSSGAPAKDGSSADGASSSTASAGSSSGGGDSASGSASAGAPASSGSGATDASAAPSKRSGEAAAGD